VKIIEQIGHIEWTLGITFLIYSLFNITINGFEIFIIVISGLLPDLIDLAVFNKKNFHTYHRVFTHSFLGLVLLFGVSYILPVFYLITFGFALHLLEDILGGGGIFILPFKGKIVLLDDNKRKHLGAFIRPCLEQIFEETEYLPEELTWFFFLTITGSIVLGVGLVCYLI